MTTTQGAKILRPQELEKIRHPLPQSWIEAAGILNGKKRINALRYQRQIRKEWNKRLEKLAKIFRL